MTPEELEIMRARGKSLDARVHHLSIYELDHAVLIAEIDRLRAENYLLRQGRGGTPETHVADDRTPLHLTHPIENSQETT